MRDKAKWVRIQTDTGWKHGPRAEAGVKKERQDPRPKSWAGRQWEAPGIGWAVWLA